MLDCQFRDCWVFGCAFLPPVFSCLFLCVGVASTHLFSVSPALLAVGSSDHLALPT